MALRQQISIKQVEIALVPVIVWAAEKIPGKINRYLFRVFFFSFISSCHPRLDSGSFV
jgi:hypothetical protein